MFYAGIEGWPTDTEWNNVAAWLAGHANRRFILSLGTLSNTYKRQWDNLTWDAQIAAQLDKLQTRGMGPKTVVRIDWEMNGSWFGWGSTVNGSSSDADYAGYIRRFRRIAAIVRAHLPNALINWCPNGFPTNAINWYPGNDVVDIVGMDRYDIWLGSSLDPATRWNLYVVELQRQRDFAIARNKVTALDEWGMCTVDRAGIGGGDSPYYVTHVKQWAVNPVNKMLYTCYFNNNKSDVQSLITNFPSGKAQYTIEFAGYS